MADLITSTRAKQSINQASFTTAENTQIASLVSAVSAAVERYCGRTFASTAYDEYYDGHDSEPDLCPDRLSQYLLLNHYPIVSLTGISDAGSVLDSSTYTVLAAGGMVRREVGWSVGYRRYRVQYTAGYATVPEDVQEACAQWVAALFWQTKDNPASYPLLPTAAVALLLDPYKLVRLVP